MKKPVVWITICTILLLLVVFWYLKTSLWLERLLVFGQMPVQGKSWNTEVEKFSSLYPGDDADCFFLGDSHMEQCEWQELFLNIRCANRGIGGETTKGLLLRLHSLPPKGKNRFVFLQTGVNDLIDEESSEKILMRYGMLLDTLLKRNFRPVPTLVFPVRYLKHVNARLPDLNTRINDLAKKRACRIISINDTIREGNRLSAEFSADGIHLNTKGYRIWAEEIKRLLQSPPDSCCQ